MIAVPREGHSRFTEPDRARAGDALFIKTDNSADRQRLVEISVRERSINSNLFSLNFFEARHRTRIGPSVNHRVRFSISAAKM